MSLDNQGTTLYITTILYDVFKYSTDNLWFTIDPVKCHIIKAEEILQFRQRNLMISENSWNVLMR